MIQPRVGWQGLQLLTVYGEVYDYRDILMAIGWSYKGINYCMVEFDYIYSTFILVVQACILSTLINAHLFYRSTLSWYEVQ